MGASASWPFGHVPPYGRERAPAPHPPPSDVRAKGYSVATAEALGPCRLQALAFGGHGMYLLTVDSSTLQHATRRLGISTPRTYRAAREAFTRFLPDRVRRLAGGHEAGLVVGAYTIFLTG